MWIPPCDGGRLSPAGRRFTPKADAASLPRPMPGGRRSMNEYQVGYGKPPRHARFKKGQSGNPRGRPRKPEPDPIDIAAVLTEPIPVRIGGTSREMDVFEVWLRGLAKRALTDGNLGAALEFLKVCAKHGAIAPPPASQ